MLRFYFYMIFTLTSAFACLNKASAQVVSKDQSDLSVSVKTKDASAKDASDGYIQLSITGGVPPYDVSIFRDPLIQEFKENIYNLELKDLRPGSFLFVIKDSTENITQQSVRISYNK